MGISLPLLRTNSSLWICIPSGSMVLWRHLIVYCQHGWPSTRPNRITHNLAAHNPHYRLGKLHTTEPAHYGAAGLCAARWCAARLCVFRLGCVEGHPWSGGLSFYVSCAVVDRGSTFAVCGGRLTLCFLRTRYGGNFQCVILYWWLLSVAFSLIYHYLPVSTSKLLLVSRYWIR